jgi:hypothetical protein
MLKNGVTYEKLLKKSAFPVLEKDVGTAQGRREYGAAIMKTIGPLPASVRARIEAFQPCNTNHEWSHQEGGFALRSMGDRIGAVEILGGVPLVGPRVHL